MRRRHLILVTPALAAVVALPAAAQGRAGEFRELRWDDLMPKDWDPLKNFRGMNLSMFNDGDPKVQQLLKELRDEFDRAPVVAALNNTQARLPGYVVPLEEGAQGELKEFLLVPYFGACIHTPPPPANQIVHVSTVRNPPKNLRAMDVVWVNGTLRTKRIDTYMGVSAYEFDASAVTPYVVAPPAKR